MDRQGHVMKHYQYQNGKCRVDRKLYDRLDTKTIPYLLYLTLTEDMPESKLKEFAQMIVGKIG